MKQQAGTKTKFNYSVHPQSPAKESVHNSIY